MYAIPAETVSQGQPFQKENLPGPGKCTHHPPVVPRYPPIIQTPGEMHVKLVLSSCVVSMVDAASCTGKSGPPSAKQSLPMEREDSQRQGSRR